MADTVDTTAETTVEAATQETTEAVEQLDDPGKKALDAERRARREAEREAKRIKAELDQLRQSSLTDAERAIEQARTEGRSAALAEAGSKLVAAEMKAAAAGRLESAQLSTLLAGVHLPAFLDADGNVDTEKVSDFIDGIAPAHTDEGPAPAGFPDIGQGARGSTVPLNGDPLLRDLKSKLGIR